MKTQKSRAIILLQYLKSKEDFRFSSELLTYLQRQKGQSDTLFSLDNYSDALTTHYARQLMEGSDEVLIICDVENCESLGATLPILNYAIKQKQVKLYTNGKNKLLGPFMKFLNGQLFYSLDELKIS